MYSRALRGQGLVVDEGRLNELAGILSTSSSFLLVMPSSLASSWT